MSDIYRVFARLGGGHPTATEQRELRSVPRRGGAAGSRVVEVVRLPTRGSASGRAPSQQPGARVRALTWEDGFPTKAASLPSRSPEPAPNEAVEPVAHVMPAWQPSIAEPAFDPAQGAPPPAERARRKARGATRRVANPFDTDDEGANCLRCGYLIQPARERRGLMTCAGCG